MSERSPTTLALKAEMTAAAECASLHGQPLETAPSPPAFIRSKNSAAQLRVHPLRPLAVAVLLDLLLRGGVERLHRDHALRLLGLERRLDGGAEDGRLDRAAAQLVAVAERGEVDVGGERAAMYNTVYLERRGGNCLRVTNGHDGLSDVMVLAGAPIGAPVVASGTMVMNSDAQVQQAMYDYQRGTFGRPWDHRVDDEEWAAACDARQASGVVR